MISNYYHDALLRPLLLPLNVALLARKKEGKQYAYILILFQHMNIKIIKFDSVLQIYIITENNRNGNHQYFFS